MQSSSYRPVRSRPGVAAGTHALSPRAKSADDIDL